MAQSLIEINYPIQISEYDYTTWSIEHTTFLNGSINFIEFFNKCMMKNVPCIIKNVIANWECARKWVNSNEINYEYLIKVYGELIAPVSDCKNIEFNSQCKTDMKVHAYLNYLKNRSDEKLLYLKDWHLKRSRPNDMFYEIPSYFVMDWLNEFSIDNKEDDFMFVYIGPKGSWTPLHEDVYCSYSWSVNVIGRKKWILFPPEEENKLKDKFDNLPLLFEQEKYKDVKYFEIVQEKGDALFVPSGWHHQVLNELDTISINHNWINACNIGFVWEGLQKCLKSVEHQIFEFKDTPEYSSQCQLMLKSLFGMDSKSFIIFLCYIANKRLSQLRGESETCYGQFTLGLNAIKFDLENILKVMNSIHVHPMFLNKVILSSIEDEFLKVKSAVSAVFI